MIRTFRNQNAARIFRREFCRKFQAIAAVAKQFRIYFVWEAGEAHDVEITDCH